MTGCTVSQYTQFETSPETIEQELQPAVCELRQTDRLKKNYSVDIHVTLACSYAAGASNVRTDVPK